MQVKSRQPGSRIRGAKPHETLTTYLFILFMYPQLACNPLYRLDCLQTVGDRSTSASQALGLPRITDRTHPAVFGTLTLSFIICLSLGSFTARLSQPAKLTSSVHACLWKRGRKVSQSREPRLPTLQLTILLPRLWNAGLTGVYHRANINAFPF